MAKTQWILLLSTCLISCTSLLIFIISFVTNYWVSLLFILIIMRIIYFFIFLPLLVIAQSFKINALHYFDLLKVEIEERGLARLSHFSCCFTTMHFIKIFKVITSFFVNQTNRAVSNLHANKAIV